MVIVRYFLVFMLSSVLLACGQATITDAYTDTNGAQGRFSDHHGRWMVINYWAVWCTPCIAEIPEINEFAQKHSSTVSVFSVNFDDKQGEQLIEQSNKLGITFPTLTADPSKVMGFARPTVLPTTLIFDKTGKLHRTLIGPQSSNSLEQAIGLKN